MDFAGTVTDRVVVVSTLAATILGMWNARRTPRVREASIPYPDLPHPLSGFTIVQLSDMHVGPTIRQAFVSRVIHRVNTLGADVVSITGDLLDGPLSHRGGDIAPLAGLRSRHGSFAVTGNHEYYHGVGRWIAAWRRRGLTILMNEHRILEHDRASLLLAGVTDYSAAPFGPKHASDADKAMRSGGPSGSVSTPDNAQHAHPGLRVLLAHQPHTASLVDK